MNQGQLTYLTALLNAKSQDEIDYILFEVMPGSLTSVERNEVLETFGIQGEDLTIDDLIARLSQVKEMLDKLKTNTSGNEEITSLTDLEREVLKVLSRHDQRTVLSSRARFYANEMLNAHSDRDYLKLSELEEELFIFLPQDECQKVLDYVEAHREEPTGI